VISFLLGVLIWAGWPGSSEWVIGTFVGIDLIFNGWSLLVLGWIVRRAPLAPPSMSPR
jgi:uncharacterized membrane protein HdeD (DUF308 family)